MRYFGFLLRFVILPLLLLRIFIWQDRRNETRPPDSLQNWPENIVLAGHVMTAVAYTTPWDNYLVASGIWWYEPELVTGKTIGWVPIEEYSFFVLQTLLTGSWLQFLEGRVASAQTPNMNSMPTRIVSTGALALVWLWSINDLVRGKFSRRYLNLILSWALPPIGLQLAYGGDILWQNRTLLAFGIIPPTLYLGVTDSLAIDSGTWTINPDATIKKEVIPHLPVEELLFFFLTNVLLVFGMVLVQSRTSEARLPESIRRPYSQFKKAVGAER